MSGKLLFAWFFLCVHTLLRGQDFNELNGLLKSTFDQMVVAKTDAEKLEASGRLADLFVQTFAFPEAYDAPFDALKNVGIVSSPDGKFKIFNWNVPLSDFTHHYEGFIVKAPDKKDGKISFERLKHEKKPIQKPENKFLDADQWFGALYYEIIPVKDGRNTLYTLLGWHGNDRLTTKKVIDVLDISGRTVKFGAPIFKLEKATLKRVIFEYKAEVQMSLRYSPKDKIIVYDHLSPMHAGMEGNYAFYGPDLTFDGFAWEKGKWVHKSNVDARIMRDNVKRPYNDPRR